MGNHISKDMPDACIDAKQILVLNLVLPWLTIPQLLHLSSTCKKLHDHIFATPALWKQVKQRWPTEPFVNFLLPKISNHVQALEFTNLHDYNHVLQLPIMPSVVSLLISVVTDKGSPAEMILKRLHILQERFPNLQQLSLVLQQFSIAVQDPSLFTEDPPIGAFLQWIVSKWPNLRGISLMWEPEALFCAPFRLSEHYVSEIVSSLQNNMPTFKMLHTNGDTTSFLSSLKCIDTGGTTLQHLGISSTEMNAIDLSHLWHFKALHTFEWHLVDRHILANDEDLVSDLSPLGEVKTLKCLKVRGLILWSAEKMITLFSSAKFKLKTLALCMETYRSLNPIKFQATDPLFEALAGNQKDLMHISIYCSRPGMLQVTDAGILSLTELPRLAYVSLGSRLTYVTSNVWNNILNGRDMDEKWKQTRVLVIDQDPSVRKSSDTVRQTQCIADVFGPGSVVLCTLDSLSFDDAKTIIKSHGYSSDEIMRRIIKLKWPQLTM